MATAGIVSGEMVIDPSGGGIDGWGGGILTLTAAPSGSNRMKFAYKCYADSFSNNYTSLGYGASWSTSAWFGLRFTNSKLDPSNEIKGVSDNPNGQANPLADDFLGYFAGTEDSGVGITTNTLQDQNNNFWSFRPYASSYDTGSWFSFGMSYAEKTRLPIWSSGPYTTGPEYNFPNTEAVGLQRTFGWEVYKHSLNNTMLMRFYYSDDSISEVNILDVFDAAYLLSSHTIHGDVTSKWVDISGNVSFPRYFMVQMPYLGPTIGNSRTFHIPVIAYQYLQDS